MNSITIVSVLLCLTNRVLYVQYIDHGEMIHKIRINDLSCIFNTPNVFRVFNSMKIILKKHKNVQTKNHKLKLSKKKTHKFRMKKNKKKKKRLTKKIYWKKNNNLEMEMNKRIGCISMHSKQFGLI